MPQQLTHPRTEAPFPSESVLSLESITGASLPFGKAQRLKWVSFESY